jgi:hypothetical protein
MFNSLYLYFDIVQHVFTNACFRIIPIETEQAHEEQDQQADDAELTAEQVSNLWGNFENFMEEFCDLTQLERFPPF